MTGTNVPMRVHHAPPYQIAEYEHRRQPFSVWTQGYPQKVVYFAYTLKQAQRFAARHVAMAGSGLLKPVVSG